MAKKFIVACGGTGGHSFPGLAVAQELRARGHEVVVWASGRAIEGSVMKSWDGAVFSTGARPLTVRNVFTNTFSLMRCSREMKKFAPDALLAMGSYASLTPVLAASMRHVPVVLHEANTVPGRAEIAGQPRLDEVPQDAFCVFVTGGSQGAHRVNELAVQAMALVQSGLARRMPGKRLFVIHQTGAADEEMVRQRYEAMRQPARVNAFETEMGRAFATADMVVARAGASTCFELARVGKPAFFIPLPSAVRNHQHFNALAFVQAGAADEGIQDSLAPRALANYILNKIEHPEMLAKKAAAMLAMSVPDAAAKVADLMERVAG